MTKYNYLAEMVEDVKDAIQEFDIEGMERDEIEEMLNDELWCYDSVTGNGSGSYYCNSWKAAEAIAHNKDLLIEALEEFGDDAESYKKAILSPEYADVTIRCYLLGQAINEALDELGI